MRLPASNPWALSMVLVITGACASTPARQLIGRGGASVEVQVAAGVDPARGPGATAATLRVPRPGLYELSWSVWQATPGPLGLRIECGGAVVTQPLARPREAVATVALVPATAGVAPSGEPAGITPAPTEAPAPAIGPAGEQQVGVVYVDAPAAGPCGLVVQALTANVNGTFTLTRIGVRPQLTAEQRAALERAAHQERAEVWRYLVALGARPRPPRPAPLPDPAGPSPFGSAIWVSGAWSWGDDGWLWVPGAWIDPVTVRPPRRVIRDHRRDDDPPRHEVRDHRDEAVGGGHDSGGGSTTVRDHRDDDRGHTVDTRDHRDDKPASGGGGTSTDHRDSGKTETRDHRDDGDKGDKGDKGDGGGKTTDHR